MANVGDTKGRGGHIIFRRFGDILHPIQWSDRRLRRISRSISTAEFLAAAESISNGLYLKALHGDLHINSQTELTVDSTSLQALSTLVKEPEERLNKVELTAIREAYDDGELTTVHWCPAQKLLVDPLTKDTRNTVALLLEVLSSCRHKHPLEMKSILG